MLLSRVHVLGFGLCQSWLATLGLAQATTADSSCVYVYARPRCKTKGEEEADQTRRTSTRSFSHIDLDILTDAPAFSSFRTSMNIKYSTPGSANPVAVFITSTTAGTRTIFATGYYGYAPLTSEGFAIYTSVFPVTSCTPLTPTTPTLPPSPTGSICSAHGDHCKS